MEQGHAGPVRPGDRFRSLDFLRGVALFGILLMNITAFGLHPAAYGDPTVQGGATGYNYWAWFIAQIGFEGTQRGLFSLLFGAGVVLLTSRLEAAGRTDTADIYYRRNLWLIVFGVFHAYVLLWWGEILYAYGVTALFLYVFRHMAPRWLMTIGIAGILVSTAWNYADTRAALAMAEDASAAEAAATGGAKLTEEQQAAIDDWKDYVANYKPSQKEIEEVNASRRGSYLDVAKSVAPINQEVQSWWMYRFFFDIFSMMLFGMALFRMGFLTLEQPTHVYVLTMLVGWTIGLALNWYEVQTVVGGNFSVAALSEDKLTYDISRIAMTFGHLGALLLFFKSGALGWFRRSMEAVGTLAFTNYIMQSVICAFVFYGFGFGLFGHLERYQLYFVVLAIWLFQLILSPIWLRHFHFGPLEWGWRWLTYLERPKFRRGDATIPAPAR